MLAAAARVFSAIADPTRRAIFERLCRDGEQTVRVLTDRAGVSQPAVSKHLAVLKRARLVHDRREGRQAQALRGFGWRSIHDVPNVSRSIAKREAKNVSCIGMKI